MNYSKIILFITICGISSLTSFSRIFDVTLYENNGRKVLAQKRHPEFAFLLPQMAGNFKLGIIAGDKSVWINESTRFQDFGHSHWKNSLMWAIGEEDITICGQGTIYGQGLTREGSRRKGVGNKAVSLKKCKQITMKDIHLYIGFMEPDARPAFVLDDALNIDISETEVSVPDGVKMTELRNGSTLNTKN
jgi:hypothetical protein